MHRKISFLIKTLIIILLLTSNNLATELTIIPLKKPILDKIIKAEKLTKGIIKPKSKPKKDEFKENKKKIEVVKKVEKKINFLLPKSKPLIVKKKK